MNESDTNLGRGTTTRETREWKNEAEKIKAQWPHETREWNGEKFKWRHSNETEKKRKTGEEIVWNHLGCREVGDAVNEIYCFLPTFICILMKGIIVNFGGAGEGLEVQGKAPWLQC